MDYREAKQWKIESKRDLESAIKDKAKFDRECRDIGISLEGKLKEQSDTFDLIRSKEQEIGETNSHVSAAEAICDYWKARYGCAISLADTSAGMLARLGAEGSEYAQEFLKECDHEIATCKGRIAQYDSVISTGNETLEDLTNQRFFLGMKAEKISVEIGNLRHSHSIASWNLEDAIDRIESARSDLSSAKSECRKATSKASMAKARKDRRKAMTRAA